MEAALTSRYVVRGSGAVSGVSNPIYQIQIMSLPGQLGVVSDQNLWVRLRTKAVAELCVKTSVYRPTSGFWFSTVYCSHRCPLGQWCPSWSRSHPGLLKAFSSAACESLYRKKWHLIKQQIPCHSFDFFIAFTLRFIEVRSMIFTEDAAIWDNTRGSSFLWSSSILELNYWTSMALLK